MMAVTITVSGKRVAGLHTQVWQLWHLETTNVEITLPKWTRLAVKWWWRQWWWRWLWWWWWWFARTLGCISERQPPLLKGSHCNALCPKVHCVEPLPVIPIIVIIIIIIVLAPCLLWRSSLCQWPRQPSTYDAWPGITWSRRWKRPGFTYFAAFSSLCFN